MSRLPEGRLPPTWNVQLAEIEREIRRIGFWSGEARYLRDAAGRQRLGQSGSDLLIRALTKAGFEPDPTDLRYESQPISVTRIGASALTERSPN